jgi:hypothetical protein
MRRTWAYENERKNSKFPKEEKKNIKQEAAINGNSALREEKLTTFS